MVLLPDVLATMSNASKIATPLESIVPIVRVNLATAAFVNSSPNTGSLSTILSINSCPFSVFLNLLKAKLVMNMPPIIKCILLISVRLIHTTIFVGSGKSPPKLENISSNTGITKIKITPSTMHAMAIVTIG